jgi:signal transduction histidine kinase
MNHREHRDKIKLHLLFPVGLGVSLLLISSLFILENLQQKNLNEEMSRYVDHVEDMFQSELAVESRALQSSLDFLLKDVSLQNAWKKRDRQALLEDSLPIYQAILSKQDITHLYFMEPNSVCFLRVHQPPRYGDHIKRFTMAQASQTGQTAWGIELGPLGTFTLRVVSPWRIDGKIQGYIEVGREVQLVAEHIKKTLNIELFFVINKSYLDRAGWEKGLAVLGRKGQWEQFPDFILTSSTLEELPAAVFNHINAMEECASEEHLGSIFDVTWNGGNYKAKPIKLSDAGGRDVGDMLIMTDVNSKVAAIHRLSMILIGVYGALYLFLISLFYFYFRRIKQNLNTIYTDLRQETEEHRKTKDQAEQQSQFLRGILESLSYPFYVIDAESHRVILANSAACPDGMPAGATCHAITHHRDEPCNDLNDPCPLEEIKRTKKPVIVEHIHFDSTGAARNMEVHSFPVLDSQGDVLHVIEYSIDITDRKETQKELVNARNRAEESTRLKSEFLANMSHEIRTPMNAIIGFGDLLCHEELTRTQREYADVILHSSRLLLQLINDILDFSKIEANKLALDFTECSVRELIKDLDILFRPQVQKKGLAFEIYSSGDLPSTIITDSTRLRQCLINLLGNAMKFTSRGGVSVTVRMEQFPEGPQIGFDVQDTGIGIPKEKLSSVFDAFIQGDSSTSRRYGGTGLGLSITHKLVELLGGHISVSSEPGKGSTFSILLPVKVAAEVPVEV